jgi:predicted permease
MAEEDGVRRGLSVGEARRQARVQLGGVTQLRESWRAAWGLTWLDGLALDVKLGLRMLRRSWGLTLAGGLAMTIVITIAAVAFVFLDEFMGRTPPPLEEGERIVAIQNWDAQARLRRDILRQDVDRWAGALRSVEHLGAFQTVERRLIIDGFPAEWIRAAEISASAFQLARVPPVVGRWIGEGDEQPAAAPVVVIGYDVWQSRFAGDRAAIGKTIRVGEVVHTVVGVMPEGFAFPVNHRYWIPLLADPSGSIAAAPEGAVFARLAPGISLDGAQAEVSTVGLLPPSTTASHADARRPRVVPYTFAFTDDVEPGELAWGQRIILLLLTLLLVPPCLNIAILIYARTVTRQEEFAARFALGASRTRIVTQLCVEVLVLSSIAGALALLFVRPILGEIGDIVRRFPSLGGALPFWVDFRFSWRTALFVAGLSVVAALIAGLLPALRATGRVLPLALRSLGSRTRVPLGATWTALIVVQVGLALAALPSTVELAWGQLRPSILGPGFQSREFLTARLSLASDSVLRQIQTQLGPTEVAFATALPGAEPSVVIERESAPGAGASARKHYVKANQVDWAFMEVFEMQALAGRTFDGRDFGPGSSVVVDQTFVREVFGESSAIGRRIRPVAAPGKDPGPWFEIVGVVSDRPANTSHGRLYLPAMFGTRGSAASVHLALAAGPDPAAMSRRIQEIGTTLGPSVRLEDVRTLDDVLREAQLTGSLTSYVLVVVTMSVLVLSAVGLYALMSFTVAQRRREIGIRTALGARPGKLVASVFARAMWQVSGGVAVGVAIALFLHRRLNIEVEGGWHIPGILPAAAIFMLAIGLMAAAGPACRAVRVDPTEALRDG